MKDRYRARGRWPVPLLISGALVLSLGAWFNIGPLGRLWPRNRGLSAVSQLADHQWRPGRVTVVLALSFPCSPCLENIGFFQALSRAAQDRFDIIAAFDGSAREGEEQLNALDVVPSRVIDVPAAALGIDSVPAVILADDMGRVVSVWSGVLDSMQRSEIAALLGVELFGETLPAAEFGSFDPATKQGTSPAEPNISIARLRSAFLAPERLVIIDTRPRGAFAERCIDGSINIPINELETRSLHEIDPAYVIFVFCDHCLECELSIPSVARRSLCRRSRDDLRQLGYVDVQVIDATLDELGAAGIPLVSRPAR